MLKHNLQLTSNSSFRYNGVDRRFAGAVDFKEMMT